MKNTHICTQCELQQKPLYVRRWSAILEVILWIFTIVLWLFYTLWRSSNIYFICKDCKTETVIKTNSPKWKELLNIS